MSTGSQPTMLTITGPDSHESVVLVRLNSIEHQAGRNDEVATGFEVELTITDGTNPKGKFGPISVSLKPGKVLPVDEQIFVGMYPFFKNFSVGEITFHFRAETDTLAGIFTGVTSGENDLTKPGVFHFAAPVVLENGADKSTLVFRGRIDVSG